jgi:hypothetical protein
MRLYVRACVLFQLYVYFRQQAGVVPSGELTIQITLEWNFVQFHSNAILYKCYFYEMNLQIMQQSIRD